MKTKSFLAYAALLVGAFALIACGPKKPPKAGTGKGNTTGPAGDPANASAVPKKPKRKLSADAKTDFTKAVKKYYAAKKTGIKGNCDSVASAFADVYSSHPKVVEAKFNEGVVWEECGKDSKAEAVYKEILRKHPRHAKTINNLGQIYYRRGQVGAARSQWQRAAALKNSEGYANLALLQRQQALGGNTSALRDAVNNIHRALAVDSFNIEAYNLLATLLYDHARTKSQLTMARLICVQASKQRPDFAPIYNLLGLINMKQGKVTPALARFRKAVSLNPNFVEALMNIGAITLSFRDYKTAEESFRKVLGLKVGKAVRYAATVGLGVALRGQRKFTEAMAQYKAAEKMDPSNGDISYNKGLLVQDYLFNPAKPQDGIDQLNKAKGLLQKYLSSGKDRTARKDANRRVKNINALVKALRQQMKMMAQMKAMQAKQAAQDAAAKKAAAKKPAPKKAPAKKK